MDTLKKKELKKCIQYDANVWNISILNFFKQPSETSMIVSECVTFDENFMYGTGYPKNKVINFRFSNAKTYFLIHFEILL